MSIRIISRLFHRSPRRHGVGSVLGVMLLLCLAPAAGTAQVELGPAYPVSSVGKTEDLVCAPAREVPPETESSSTGLSVGSHLESLHVNLSLFPATLDPQKTSWVSESANLDLIYEGLTRLNDQLETVPAAAESWEYSPSGTVLTFTLRSGLAYNDGSVLNALRFRYAILRTIDPATNAPYADWTDVIVGAAEWRDGSGTQAGVALQALDLAQQPCSGYGQADCRLLTMTLRHPAPYFHTLLSQALAFPAKEEIITAGGANWWQDPQHHIGNGPFSLVELTTSVRTRFTPNPNYWRGVPGYDIVFHYVADSVQALDLYRAGQLDIMSAGPSIMPQIVASPVLSQELLTFSGACTFAIFMNNTLPPFTDPKVRQAFAYGLDREAWVSDVMAGGGRATLTWVPPGFPGFDATEGRWAYSPTDAVAALAASTYGSASALPPIALTFRTTSNTARWQWLANKWHDVLGVNISLNPVDNPTYREQLYLLGWCADYPDPQNWLSLWRTGGYYHSRIGYSNPALDALIDQAGAELDPPARMALYQQAQTILVGDLPVVFFYNSRNAYLVRHRIHGVVTTPQDSGWAGQNDPLRITVDAWKRVYLPLVLRP